ncbi:hypothetical protein B9Z55_012225 [Caenorhabditis nigoni]|uniref:Uncharacterized protein n=1 Tax=Caenorhabditis nigoni TaxID=1611254 RepID=A0A2G5TX80_9PELO|nr:hypothetical protein B9Z55_012225 [Caenorhabditis nigoni]
MSEKQHPNENGNLIDFNDDDRSSTGSPHEDQEEEVPRTPVAPTTPVITIDDESAPIVTTKAAGSSKAAEVAPTTSTPTTGARRKKETVATEVPPKKARMDQDEMIKLINKRIRTIEKDIEYGRKGYLLMEKMEKSLEDLQTTFKNELMKHGAGLHADLKKGFEENRGSHQKASHEIHSTHRKVDGLVSDSLIVKTDLTKIQVLVEDSRQLWLKKMTKYPKPDYYPSTPREYCAFCGGYSHQPEDCEKKSCWRVRRMMIANKGKCFLCLQKHQEGDVCSRDGVSCETCTCLYPHEATKARHHPALCEHRELLGTPTEEPYRFARSSRGRVPRGGRGGRGRGRGRGSHHGKQ